MSRPAAKRPFIVGLTGGIASGKTAVSDRFQAAGARVIDTDVLARAVVAPGSDGLAAVRERFGDEVIDRSGALDRAALRQRIFADADERRALEAIIHPRIRARVHADLAQVTAPYAVLVIPLLVEAGWQSEVDRVLLVDVPEATQIRRLMARDDIDAVEAERMLASQADRETRRAAADDVIANTGSLSALDAAVAALDRKYRQMADNRP